MRHALRLRAGTILVAVSRITAAELVDAMSLLAGALVCAAITTVGLIVGPPGHDWWPALWIPCIATGGLFALAVTRLLALTVLIRLWRGASAVAWHWPKECTSVYGWIGGTWKFESASGRQEGMRVLGLSLALQGKLVPAKYFV